MLGFPKPLQINKKRGVNEDASIQDYDLYRYGIRNSPIKIGLTTTLSALYKNML